MKLWNFLNNRFRYILKIVEEFWGISKIFWKKILKYIDKEVIKKNNDIMVKIVNGNIDVIGSGIGYCTCWGWWASTQQTSALVGVSVNHYG